MMDSWSWWAYGLLMGIWTLDGYMDSWLNAWLFMGKKGLMIFQAFFYITKKLPSNMGYLVTPVRPSKMIRLHPFPWDQISRDPRLAFCMSHPIVGGVINCTFPMPQYHLVNTNHECNLSLIYTPQYHPLTQDRPSESLVPTGKLSSSPPKGSTVYVIKLV